MSLKKIPCSNLKGVGPKISQYLTQLEIHSVFDLLLHFPIRYENRTKITKLCDLKPNETALVEGIVQNAQISHFHRGKSACTIQDETSQLTLWFFHAHSLLRHLLKPGIRLRCFGKARLGKRGFEMVHPDYKIVEENTPLDRFLTPIYPSTEGLHQSAIRKIISQALILLKDQPQDFFPVTLFKHLSLEKPSKNHSLDFYKALFNIHQPLAISGNKNAAETNHLYRQRFIFEELIAQQVKLISARKKAQNYSTNSIKTDLSLLKRFKQELPFKLTTTQKKAIEDIYLDIEKPYPMLRLLQGDVGSGKTIVAIATTLMVTHANKQVAVLVPTELLAEQHFETFSTYLKSFGTQIILLTGKLSANQKAIALEKIHSGFAQVIIGTHAIFQNKVNFFDLSLIIVDEQHRFGIHQRLLLKQKGAKQRFRPHQLIITATPIPRSLAMSAYAHLDYSAIKEKPSMRQPITTIVIPNRKKQEVIEKIQTILQQGQQIYWVCPLIDASEELTWSAAKNVVKELKAQLPNQKMALLHGKMDAAQKENTMSAFKNKQYDLLVCTTVIEVGIDVPNATLIVIENAERLGLAQLHQLRGRVGRGDQKSYCILMYKPPLTTWAKERLKTIQSCQDGFAISQKDLEMRGPGEILGMKQAGNVKMRIADPMRDFDLICPAQEIAKEISEHHPEIIEPLISRWFDGITHDGQV